MKTLIVSLFLMGMASITYAQSVTAGDKDLSGNRSALSVRRSEYPRILPGNRAELKYS